MFHSIEYNSIDSDTTAPRYFCSKDEATSFYNNTKNLDAFKSSKYKAKILGHITSTSRKDNLFSFSVSIENENKKREQIILS